MHVSLSQMLVLSVLVRRMGVCNRSVVVFVRVQGSEMLPFAHDLVRALPAIVCHMWMVVAVHDGIVAVLDVLGDVRPFTNLVEDTTRRRKHASRQERQKGHETDGSRFCDVSFHGIPLIWAALVSRLS
jgi:hypothetical protein